MGELNDTSDMERRAAKKNGPGKGNRTNIKPGPGRGGLKKIDDYHGMIDVLAEMQWRLDNPSVDADTPIRKQITQFYLKEFPSFMAQYTELRAAKANEELAKAHRAGTVKVLADGAEPLEVNETDLKIDEAIDRVIQQLEEMGNDPGVVQSP